MAPSALIITSVSYAASQSAVKFVVMLVQNSHRQTQKKRIDKSIGEADKWLSHLNPCL